MTTKIIIGDALETLKTLPDESVHCIVTSPPYFGLRDYGTAEWEGGDAGCDHKQTTARHDGGRVNTDGFHGSAKEDSDKGAMNYRHTCAKCGAARVDQQMGLEATPEEFLANMVEVFREARRVLRSDGVCFVNMGDSYASSGKGNDGNEGYNDGRKNRTSRLGGRQVANLKPKDLMGMPWRLALALQQPHLQCKGCGNVAHKSAWGHFPNGRLICPACIKSKGWTVAEQGWWLRSDIIWAKPNPMPESVTDRPTKAHEYVFLLTKSARYFYDADAVREDHKADSLKRYKYGLNVSAPADGFISAGANNKRAIGHSKRMEDNINPAGRNRRTVWTIATQPFSAAHFATFPTKLVEPMIKAGTSEKGCCPECGGPWERVVEKGFTSHDAKTESAYSEGSTANRLALLRQSARKNGGEYTSGKTTTGWQPTCDHDHDPIPCTVLDFFAGAFTVGLVADRLGRDSIMIELNPGYAAMGEQRIKDDAGWIADVQVEENVMRQLELI